MTRRKQEQPKRLKSSGDEDDSEENEDGKRTDMALEDTESSHHDNQSCNHGNQPSVANSSDVTVISEQSATTMSIGESVLDNQPKSESLSPSSSQKDSDELVSEKSKTLEDSEKALNTDTPVKPEIKSEISKGEQDKMGDLKLVKEKLKTSVKVKCEVDENRWVNANTDSPVRKSSTKSRPETPPLQKLMRQDFSPLKSNSLYSPSPPKRMKEGFTSKLASVIVPTSSLLPRPASHPKQLMSHSSNKIRSSCIRSIDSMKMLRTSHLHKPNPFSHGRPLSSSASDDQPLDLSKKSTKDQDPRENRPRKHHSSHFGKHSPGNGFSPVASSSLQSLQQKFGGDFHLRGLRKPTNYMLFGPEIPAIHKSLVHSPHVPLGSNGLPKPASRADLSPMRKGSTPSPKNEIDEPPCKSAKIEETAEKSIKVEKGAERDSASSSHSPPTVMEDEDLKNDKYTNHMCTCGKWFNNLYSLSLHLQESGHLPAGSKSVSLLEYPKLVRGQDMWLNQESEQTRRILRCIQCGESFKTLPMLTVHMMKTQHYTKIVSSEHARRAHKCSAYCDREMDKECVFKCKVCQDTFTDMEGLANHMILSGHHKKQVLRPHGYNDLAPFRPKRKRFYNFEDSVYGNPTVAALLEYKRKCLPEQSSPDLSVDNDSDDMDSTISCENCGRRIETKLFVDHVRTCLGERLAEGLESAKTKRKFFPKVEELDEKYRETSTCSPGNAKLERVISPDLASHSDQVVSPDNHSDSKDSVMSDNNCERQLDDQQKPPLAENCTEDEERAEEETKQEYKNMDQVTDRHSCDGDNSSCDVETTDTEIQENIKIESDNQKSNELAADMREATSKLKTSDKKEVKGTKEEDYMSSKADKYENSSIAIKNHSDHNSDPRRSEDSKIQSKPKLSPNSLDIIDPDNMKEGNTGNSALEAMESFIQKSFVNKFDFKKGNIVITPHSSADGTVHTRPHHTPSSKPSAVDYFNSYRNFYSSLSYHNGLRDCKNDREKNKNKTDCRNDERMKNKSHRNDESEILHIDSPKSATSEQENNGRASVLSNKSDASLDNGEMIETKYLNIEDKDQSTSKQENGGGKNSALDNLSSFVYGQPLTSEHPLDSLQRLITKSDIPKLAASSSRTFRYLPPHLQLHANPDLALPLNLSLRGRELEDSDDDEHMKAEEEGLSDLEGAGSPTNSDGDNVEYRCAACSRRFASKGSYRYHLSRCHLSSVKRYGIKEAFNMSPYVYLPLDHTAKFSKYYEMAQELANKRK